MHKLFHIQLSYFLNCHPLHILSPKPDFLWWKYVYGTKGVVVVWFVLFLFRATSFYWSGIWSFSFLTDFLKNIAFLGELQLCLTARKGCYKHKATNPFLWRAPLHLDRFLPSHGSPVMRWYLMIYEISTLQYRARAANDLLNCYFLLSCISLWAFLLFC